MQNNAIRPDHYHTGKIEVIAFIEDQGLNFSCGNAVKYICRAGKKDPEKHIEDIDKAIQYMQFERARVLKEKEAEKADNELAACSGANVSADVMPVGDIIYFSVYTGNVPGSNVIYRAEADLHMRSYRKLAMHITGRLSGRPLNKRFAHTVSTGDVVTTFDGEVIEVLTIVNVFK